MQKLWTKESLPEELPELGELHSVAQGNRKVRLLQRIVIPGAGRFTKRETIMALSAVVVKSASEAEKAKYAEENCLGVLLPREHNDPIGQLSYSNGFYHYCLPVYAAASVDDSWIAHSVLLTEEGKYAILAARRHTGLIVLAALLLLAAGAAVVIAFGWETVWNTLRGWAAALT